MLDKIVDLKLPVKFTEQEEQAEIYTRVLEYAQANRIPLNVFDIIPHLDKINEIKEQVKNENSPKYNSTYWGTVDLLNRDILNKIGWELNVSAYIFFINDDDERTPDYNYYEVELINKQFRLLQEMYYTRLELLTGVKESLDNRIKLGVNNGN